MLFVQVLSLLCFLLGIVSLLVYISESAQNWTPQDSCFSVSNWILSTKEGIRQVLSFFDFITFIIWFFLKQHIFWSIQLCECLLLDTVYIIFVI